MMGLLFLIGSLISVIMPVYGVEKYLENAINSVLNQSYKNFELILVDDKSPDKSPEICDEFALKDDRIRVIHKPVNEGLGYARNTGLDAASGEYIYFFDSDDYIEPQLLETAINVFDNETEFVVFGINRVHENRDGSIKNIEHLTPESLKSKNAQETADIFVMLNQKKVFPFAWNKLYKRAFLDKCGTRFEKTKLIEDFLFNIELFSKATFIKTIPDNLYNYRKPAHETLVSAYAPEFFDLCKRKYNLEKEYLKTVEAETEENLQLIYFSYVKHLISVFLKNNSKKSGLSKKEQSEKMRTVLSDHLTEEVLKNYIPNGIVMKIVTFLFKSKRIGLCAVFIAMAGFLIGK